MTKFSFEVPIPHLKDFDPLQDYYFMLSMLYRQNADYRFFHDQKPIWLKWLDNSYNEQMKADTVKELTDLAREAKPNRIICPDNPKWTHEEINLKFQEMRQYYPDERLIVVVSSEYMYKYMMRQGAKHFAVSYWTRPRPPFKPEHMWMFRSIHFLGLLTFEELITFEPLTCDTSMPIKLAMKGQTMMDWCNQDCPHINTKDLGVHGSDFFHSQLSEETLELAKENIEWLRNAIE